MNEIMRRALAEAMRPLVELVYRLEAKLAGKPHFEWGTVTSTNPLRVKLDSHTTPLPDRPDSLVSGLRTGDRVRVERQGTRVTVHGAGNGGNTGWINLPYTPGHTSGTAQPAQVSLHHGTVFFRGGAQKTSGTFTDGETTIVAAGGLPEWARPTQNIRFGAGAAGRRPAYMLITTAGAVIVAPDPGNAMPSWVSGDTSYPREE